MATEHMQPSFLRMRRHDAERKDVPPVSGAPSLRAVSSYPVLREDLARQRLKITAIEDELEKVKLDYEGKIAQAKTDHELALAQAKSDHEATLQLAEKTQAKAVKAQDACMAVAQGTEGWENVADECPASQAVADLRKKLEETEVELKDLREARAEPAPFAPEVKETAPDDQASSKGKKPKS